MLSQIYLKAVHVHVLQHCPSKKFAVFFYFVHMVSLESNEEQFQNPKKYLQIRAFSEVLNQVLPAGCMLRLWIEQSIPFTTTPSVEDSALIPDFRWKMSCKTGFFRVNKVYNKIQNWILTKKTSTYAQVKTIFSHGEYLTEYMADQAFGWSETAHFIFISEKNSKVTLKLASWSFQLGAAVVAKRDVEWTCQLAASDYLRHCTANFTPSNIRRITWPSNVLKVRRPNSIGWNRSTSAV